LWPTSWHCVRVFIEALKSDAEPPGVAFHVCSSWSRSANERLQCDVWLLYCYNELCNQSECARVHVRPEQRRHCQSECARVHVRPEQCRHCQSECARVYVTPEQCYHRGVTKRQQREPSRCAIFRSFCFGMTRGILLRKKCNSVVFLKRYTFVPPFRLQASLLGIQHSVYTQCISTLTLNAGPISFSCVLKHDVMGSKYVVTEQTTVV
jgi:hypothetical protein